MGKANASDVDQKLRLAGHPANGGNVRVSKDNDRAVEWTIH